MEWTKSPNAPPVLLWRLRKFGEQFNGAWFQCDHSPWQHCFCLLSACLLLTPLYSCSCLYSWNGRVSKARNQSSWKLAQWCLFFHGKNKPQKLCLWSYEYVCVFLVLFSFFSDTAWAGAIYLKNFWKESCFDTFFWDYFFACSKYKWILLLCSMFLLSSSKVNATELSQVVLIFLVMLL